MGEIEGTRELVLSERDHNLREIAQGCVDGVGVVILLLEKLEPCLQGEFAIPGMNIELLVEAPVVFDELLGMVRVPVNIGLDLAFADDESRNQHPVDHLHHDSKVLSEQTAARGHRYLSMKSGSNGIHRVLIKSGTPNLLS